MIRSRATTAYGSPGCRPISGRPQRSRIRGLALEDPADHLAQLREALDRHEGWAREGEEVFVERLSAYLGARMPESEAESYNFTALARPSAAGLRRWLEQQEQA